MTVHNICQAQGKSSTVQPRDIAARSDKLAYTVDEAGRAIGVSRSTLFDMIRMREVQAKKLRGRTLIARSELQRVLAEAPDARDN